MIDLLMALKKNKGTVSSALGKQLAGDVLNGDIELLEDAIELCTYKLDSIDAKNIRAGAAKIVEIVAEKRPELVANEIDKLMPALSVAEPQTKWMILRTVGFCAHLNHSTARKCIPYAVDAIDADGGLCLSSSAVLMLGDLGALSKEDAKNVFPIINEEAQHPVKNEEDWILESYMKIAPNLDGDERALIAEFADRCKNAPKKSTHKRVQKLKKILDKE